MPTVRVLLFRGGERVGSGPPLEIEALADGSPPPALEFGTAVVTTLRAWPGGLPVPAELGDVYRLAAHVPPAGGAVFRYNYTGGQPL